MQIEKAKEIGFCSGVRRAIDMLEKAAAEHGVVETLGAVVHNQTVIDNLAAKGVTVAESLYKVRGRMIAIPSHGAGPSVIEEMKDRGLTLIDCTCPRVRHAQKVAREMSDQGLFVVVYGEADHPEVRGILGWAAGRGVAGIDAGAVSLPDPKPTGIGILSQTTRNRADYARFVSDIALQWLTKGIELRAVNTICHATARRQVAAAALTQSNDLIIVVGGRSSSNTKRLAETCRAAGAETYLIESATDIQPSWVAGRRSVGVTAGTSTPDEVIDEVIAKLGALTA